jgi:Cu(I)/Ag(I) efflux system membrane protein CusA/SilA
MVPMAIPSIGGMTVALITIFVVPTLYCLVEELKLRTQGARAMDDDLVPAPTAGN